MKNIFFDALIIFLITYAIINIFYEIAQFLVKKFSKLPPKCELILLLNSGNTTLEADIRTAITKSQQTNCSLTIVDCDLTQQEKMILWRLTDVYENIKIVEKNGLNYSPATN